MKFSLSSAFRIGRSTLGSSVHCSLAMKVLSSLSPTTEPGPIISSKVHDTHKSMGFSCNDNCIMACQLPATSEKEVFVFDSNTQSQVDKTLHLLFSSCRLRRECKSYPESTECATQICSSQRGGVP